MGKCVTWFSTNHLAFILVTTIVLVTVDKTLGCHRKHYTSYGWGEEYGHGHRPAPGWGWNTKHARGHDYPKGWGGHAHPVQHYGKGHKNNGGVYISKTIGHGGHGPHKKGGIGFGIHIDIDRGKQGWGWKRPRKEYAVHGKNYGGGHGKGHGGYGGGYGYGKGHGGHGGYHGGGYSGHSGGGYKKGHGGGGYKKGHGGGGYKKGHGGGYGKGHGGGYYGGGGHGHSGGGHGHSSHSDGGYGHETGGYGYDHGSGAYGYGDDHGRHHSDYGYGGTKAYGYSGPYPNTEYSSHAIKTIDSPSTLHNDIPKSTSSPNSPVGEKINQLIIEEVTHRPTSTKFKASDEDPFKNPYEGYLKDDDFFDGFHFVDDFTLDNNGNSLNDDNSYEPTSFNLSPSGSEIRSQIVNSSSTISTSTIKPAVTKPKITRRWRGKNKLSASYRDPSLTTTISTGKTDASDWFVNEKEGIVDIIKRKL